MMPHNQADDPVGVWRLVMDLLPLTELDYPHIDPFVFQVPPFDVFGWTIGPLGVRWYSLAYIAGLVFAWWFLKREARKPGAPMAPGHIDDFFTWATIGVIAGGRLGYVLFYNFPKYVASPIDILFLWDGGMSFHGGLIGVVLSIILFCRDRNIDLMRFSDQIAVVAPVGLLFGRLANFINGELWGRATDVSWAMRFPSDPLNLPRHPSQLYEAFGEGLLLFLILLTVTKRTRLAKTMPGLVAGLFFIGYGTARFLVEFVREPDAHLGLMAGVSRGQVLSVPMFLFAAWLISQGVRRHNGQSVVGMRRLQDLKPPKSEEEARKSKKIAKRKARKASK